MQERDRAWNPPPHFTGHASQSLHRVHLPSTRRVRNKSPRLNCSYIVDSFTKDREIGDLSMHGPVSRKPRKRFRARKASFSKFISKNRKMYTPETSCMKGTSVVNKTAL